MPSQTEIARLSNVSQSAVSRILRGKAQEFGISEATAKRVRMIAAAVNYKPNQGAQMLLGRQTNLIGVVIKSFEDRFLATVLDELNTRALEAGHVLMVVGFKGGEYHSRVVDLLQSYRPDAFVVVGTTDFKRWEKDFLGSGKLIIQIGQPADDPRVITCGTDELQASRLLVDHLFGLGHRSIGIIGDGSATSRLRMHLLKTVIKEQPEPVSVPCLYLSELESTAAGSDCAQYLLHDIPRPHWPTALIATGDMIALAVLRRLGEQGVKVPGTVSIASFGDIDFAGLVSPSLTTVHLPVRSMAASSIQMIANTLPRKSILLDPKFMPRESTGKPGSRGSGPAQRR